MKIKNVKTAEKPAKAEKPGAGCFVAVEDSADEKPVEKPVENPEKKAKAKVEKQEKKPVEKAEAKTEKAASTVDPWQEIDTRHRSEITEWRKIASKPGEAVVVIPGGFEVSASKLASFAEIRARQQDECRRLFQRSPFAAFRHYLAAAKGDKVAALAMMGFWLKPPVASHEWSMACSEFDKSERKTK